jgi:hypothetical protein
MAKDNHRREKTMARSKAILKRWFRTMWREDPALRRFRSLEACRQEQEQAPFPVFGTQKA